jgi:predicted nucleic acid-binding protein
MILVDSNIILDLWDKDPIWAPWSEKQLTLLALTDELLINPVVYAEIAPRYSTQIRLDEAISVLDLTFAQVPREAAFLASIAFAQYRKAGGTKTGVLPDFFIGAHAAVLVCPVLTRDTRRYATYFPNVRLITP